MPETTFLPLDTLRSGAAKLGIELTDDQLSKLDDFAVLLVDTNLQFNLTRITDPDDIVTSHYLDSLTCLAALPLPEGAKVIDVGAGPGFPGIPIKIVRPDIDLVLLEATGKKAAFIGQAIEELGMENAAPLNARAEEIGQNAEYREQYDVAYARALSEMKVLAELCLPLVKVGGHVVAQKSQSIDEELSAARAIIGQLGGRVDKVEQIRIPHTDITRQLVVISKVKPTPEIYPRPYSRITAKRK